jgi:hypothetical protein
VDPEWPEAMQKALARLWEMYVGVNNAKMEQEIKHVELIFKLTEEKKNLEKAYTTEKTNVSKCINDTVKRLLKNKYHIKNGSVEQKLALSAFLPFYKVYLCEVEYENNKMKNHIEQLEFILDREKDAMTVNVRKWATEKNALNKDVKKLEHKIDELLKADDKHNAKLKTIKSICDE